MKRNVRRVAMTIVVVVLWPWWAAAQAEVPVAKITSVTVGFDHHYRLGFWAPVLVSIDYRGSDSELEIDVVVPDSDGVPTCTTTRVSVADRFPQGATVATFELVAKIGRVDGEMAVVVRAGSTELARWTADLSDSDRRGMASEDFLFVTIGEAQHLRDAVVTHLRFKTRGARLAEIATSNVLPTQWMGYDGADAVVLLAGSDVARRLLKDEARFGALATWVRNGGKLLVSMGENAEALLAADPPLAPLLPGRVERMTSVRDFNALEVFANAREALRFDGNSNRSHEVRVPKLVDVQGRIVVAEGNAPNDVPLVVQGTYGFGEILFIGIDLRRDELATWNGTGNLIARLLLPESADSGASNTRSSRELAMVGYDDLAGELRAGLNHFEAQGVRFLPFEFFFFLAVIYALVVAPGDYFFLKRYVGRMERTWITFPVVVVVACSGAYAMANYAKGDRQCRRQMDLVDIDLDTGQLRGTTWFSIFSPATERYDLAMHSTLPRAGGAPNPWLVSWLGLPGRALGGMESSTAATGLGPAYAYGLALQTLEGVPINVWSTKSFTGRVHGTTTARVEPDVAMSETSLEQILAGTITNPFDIPLTDCILLYGRWAYALGTIAPGQQAIVHEDLTIRTLESHLARVGAWTGNTLDASPDVDRTLSRMMFYEAAGGRDASPLRNRYLSAVDMTPLLRTGKAILIAKASGATMEISEGRTTAGEVVSQQETVYRFVFSIESLP